MKRYRTDNRLKHFSKLLQRSLKIARERILQYGIHNTLVPMIRFGKCSRLPLKMVYSPHQVPYSASIEGCRIIATNMSEL
jgi:hypothetical protein